MGLGGFIRCLRLKSGSRVNCFGVVQPLMFFKIVKKDIEIVLKGRSKDGDEGGPLSSEDAVLEAMDGAGEHVVQVNRSRGRSLGQGRKEQLGSWSSNQQLIVEGSSLSSCMEVERSCHDGARHHGNFHDNCLGSCSDDNY